MDLLKDRKMTAAVVAASGLLLFGALTPRTVASQEPTPEEIALGYIALIGAGEVDRAIALVSPTMVNTAFACQARFGRDCLNASEVHQVLDDAHAVNWKATVLSTSVDGNEVTVLLEARMSILGDFGIERLVQTDVFRIEDGLIVQEDAYFDLDDAQTAQFVELLFAAPPAPAEAGNLGGAARGETDPIWMALVAAAAGGLLVGLRRFLPGATL